MSAAMLPVSRVGLAFGSHNRLGRCAAAAACDVGVKAGRFGGGRRVRTDTYLTESVHA